MKKMLKSVNKTDYTQSKKKSNERYKFPEKSTMTHSKSSYGPYLAAALTAILIGLFFGVMMLNMFTQKEGQVSTNDHHSAAIHDNTDDVDKPEDKLMTLQQMNAYVLQLGVFSEIDNVNAWSEIYQQQGFPTTHFFRDHQYFLFIGIAETKEKAKEFAATLMENDIEVYVKEWTTNKVEIELTEEESNWVQLFQEQWQATLSSLSKQEGILLNDWKELIEIYPQNSDKITLLVEEIQPIFENEVEKKNDFTLQNDLLNIWKIYEEIFIYK